MRRPIFGRGQIKLAAVVLMTLNHIAEIFLDRGSLLYNLLTGIGFFTAPVMCYFLVEGFRYTRNRKNYGLRLFLFALLSQLPFSLAFHDMIRTFSIPLYLNMICTLFICFLIAFVFVGLLRNSRIIINIDEVVAASAEAEHFGVSGSSCSRSYI